MPWTIQVLNDGWKNLSIPGFRTAFFEEERKTADQTAAHLSHLFGDKLTFRVAHKDKRRGAFYPAPKPARIAS